MKAFTRFPRTEPVALGSIITASIALLTSFGLHISVEQSGAILAFVSVVVGLLTRTQTYAAAPLDELAAAGIRDKETAEALRIANDA